MTRNWRELEKKLREETGPFRITIHDPDLGLGRTSYIVEVTSNVLLKTESGTWVHKIMGTSISFDFTPSLKFLRQLMREIRRVLYEKLNAGAITLYSVNLAADGKILDTTHRDLINYVEWRFDDYQA